MCNGKMYILPYQISVSSRLAQLFPSSTNIALTLGVNPTSKGIGNPKPQKPTEVSISCNCSNPIFPKPSSTPEPSTAISDSVHPFSNPRMSTMSAIPNSPNQDLTREKNVRLIPVSIPVPAEPIVPQRTRSIPSDPLNVSTVYYPFSFSMCVCVCGLGMGRYVYHCIIYIHNPTVKNIMESVSSVYDLIYFMY